MSKKPEGQDVQSVLAKKQESSFVEVNTVSAWRRTMWNNFVKNKMIKLMHILEDILVVIPSNPLVLQLKKPVG